MRLDAFLLEVYHQTKEGSLDRPFLGNLPSSPCSPFSKRRLERRWSPCSLIVILQYTENRGCALRTVNSVTKLTPIT